MSDQTPNTPDDQKPGASEAGQANGQNRDTADLGNELREMGQQLEAALRAALESERARQLQRDLAGGVHELTHQVKTALKTIQDNPKLQQAEERGREALHRAQQSQVLNDVQETIITGLSQLNLQLRKLVERMEQSRTEAASSPTTQNVPVDHEAPPTTGETTRLNDEDQTRL